MFLCKEKKQKIVKTNSILTIGGGQIKTLGSVFIVGPFILISTTITFAMCLKSIDITGGEDHTMVLTNDKSVFTCGLDSSFYYNYTGALGIGTVSDPYYVDSLTQVLEGAMQTDSGYLENIVDISAGWQHSLANDEDGFAWAWGGNIYGQLGIGEVPPFKDEPVQVKAGEQDPYDPNAVLEDIERIAAGRSGNHSLAVDKYGLTWSWGINNLGQLGCGNTDNQFVPVAVHAGEQNTADEPNQLSYIIEVSAGAYHSMALEDPNQGAHVYTFGSNNSGYGDGLLGIGIISAPNYRTEPVKVLSGVQSEEPNTYLQNMVAASAGWHHSMALEKMDDNDPCSNGRVYTWGHNGYGWGSRGCLGGRLGNGNVNDEQLMPVRVKSGAQDPNNEDSYLQNIIAISAGESHSMSLDKDGFVWTWGDNLYGQVGDGTNTQRLTPVKVVGGEMRTEFLENIVAISTGYWHCLAIDDEGVLWAWGMGESGRLGLGDTNNNTVTWDINALKPGGFVA